MISLSSEGDDVASVVTGAATGCSVAANGAAGAATGCSVAANGATGASSVGTPPLPTFFSR
jgi:hypothetical protein